MHRLIYASRQLIAPDDLEHEVAGIIRSSIANNRMVSISGLLLVHEGWFVQALEGREDVVTSVYEKILRDPRHADCRLLSSGQVEAREFGGWNMCLRRSSDVDDRILDALAQRRVFDPPSLSARSALRLLKAVRDIQAQDGLARAS